jgi:hypothetical protein
MSDELIGTIVTAIMTVLAAALPPSIMAYRSFQEAKRAVQIAAQTRSVVVENTVVTQEVKETLREVGLKVDGRFDALVADIRAVALAEGRAAGVAETEAAATEAQRISAQSAADRARGFAEGQAEPRKP